MMKNSIKKVGTTFLGLSCLLGGVLAFTGCESYEEFKVRTTEESVRGIDYYALSKEVEAQIKLTQTYNVNTVKLYNACIEMVKDYEEMTYGNRYTQPIALEVDSSDKPSEPGESGYISFKSDTYSVSSIHSNSSSVYILASSGGNRYWLCGRVKFAPTLYIEKGSSENTSILTIKPRWYEAIRYSHSR
ncbi:MAG: hypothetical protein J5672_06785 [Verrucomicrobia bacterium]|nr:hypothetical protein [Verrucomicrobiota bacterium]